MKFTVFGATGFIGGHMVTHLRRQGYEVHTPDRGCHPDTSVGWGHVIYAIGLTGDFRNRPYDTIEAHVCNFAKLMQSSRFDSWLYLSSTRIYSSLPSGASANEEVAVPLIPGSDSLYDLSKMLAESLCLSHPSPQTRVVRLANVYGKGHSKHTFLASVLRELEESNRALIHESADSCKDYVAVGDVLPILQAIAMYGQRRIYNLASGHLTTHAELADKLQALTGAEITFSPAASRRIFPKIDINAVIAEFGYSPSRLLDQLESLLVNSTN